MFRQLPKGPGPNPHQPMVGTCASCKTPVQTTRIQARPPASTVSSRLNDEFWGDLYSAECPKCKARVLLMPQSIPSGASGGQPGG